MTQPSKTVSRDFQEDKKCGDKYAGDKKVGEKKVGEKKVGVTNMSARRRLVTNMPTGRNFSN